LHCNLCEDRGIILKGEMAFPCGCNNLKAAEKLIKNSQLPQKLLNCTLDRFNFKYYSKNCFDAQNRISHFELAKRSYQAAAEFINNFNENPNSDGLLFTGQVGSGKTFLACCIANALLSSGKMVLFAVVPDLLDKIRSTYDSGRGAEDITEFDIMDAARQVPLLVLDDLGAHNYTDWTRNKLYSIINHRLNHCLPVIVTTNIKLDELEEYLGERTTSRLLEMCRPYRLLVDLDIRVVQRKEKDIRV